MKPSTHRSKPDGHRLGLVAIAACLLAGCQAAATTNPDPEGVVKTTRTAASLINEGGPVFGLPGGGSLINEGGPVFNKPTNSGSFTLAGQLLAPRYFTGSVSGLGVGAEALDGGAFPDVTASPVAGDGSFSLQGPATGKFFFAAASFTFDDTTHRVRALARADEDAGKITLDTTSSLLAAKVALAEQKRHLNSIDFQETQDLGNMVRYKLGAQLDKVQLDAANAELSNALNVLVRQDDQLRARVRSWEYTLDPTLAPTPDSNLPAAATPTGGGTTAPTAPATGGGSNVK